LFAFAKEIVTRIEQIRVDDDGFFLRS